MLLDQQGKFTDPPPNATPFTLATLREVLEPLRPTGPERAMFELGARARLTTFRQKQSAFRNKF